MKNRFLFGLVALGAAISAHAADTSIATQPLASQPLAVAPMSKTLPLMRATPPPTMSETSVTRQRDGSLSMKCVQKPNPKQMAAKAAQTAGAQQP